MTVDPAVLVELGHLRTRLPELSASLAATMRVNASAEPPRAKRGNDFRPLYYRPRLRLPPPQQTSSAPRRFE